MITKHSKKVSLQLENLETRRLMATDVTAKSDGLDLEVQGSDYVVATNYQAPTTQSRLAHRG